MRKLNYVINLAQTSILALFFLVLCGAGQQSVAQNYGMRDDGGVNLPTVTYWHTGLSADVTEKGAQFNGQNFGTISAFFFKGAAIKTWKAAGGDVTGAQFKYKVWDNSQTEPTEYTTRNITWTSDDGGGNQTWSGFGEEIEISLGLPDGNYNVKIFFTITGTGNPGILENGPFQASFQIGSSSSAAEILSFTLPQQTGNAVINSSAATVGIEVAHGTDVTSLVPTIIVSAGATINPQSGVLQNFTNPVSYTVTAENETQKVWMVTITVGAPLPPNYGIRDDEGINLPTITYWYTGQEADITEKGAQFDDKDLGTINQLVFKGTAIKTWKTEGGDVTGAQLNYKLWKSNETEPTNYTVRNVSWSSNDGNGNQTWSVFGDEILLINDLPSGTYNIKVLFSITGTGVPGTVQDGPFTATFQLAQQSSAAEILSFTLENQIGQTILNSENATVQLRMLTGTNVTALQPVISVSPGATIDPESGVAQNFTNSVIYTVTAENQTTKVWTASIQLIEQPVFYSVTFNVDMTPAVEGGYFNPALDFVDVGANFNQWAGNGAMTASGNNIYTQTTNQIFEAGEEISFKFRINGNWETAELLGLDNRNYVVVAGENIYNAIYNQQGTINPTIVFANLQYPASATIEVGQSVNVYAQVEASNTQIVEGSGYENLTVWIGLNSDDTNPNTWTNWTQATYNGISDVTGKPEYTLSIGQNITQPGTYYYASRFQLQQQPFVYGGYSSTGGGIWNGGENSSGVLTVVEQIQYFPVTFQVTNNNTAITLVKIKGSFNEWTHVSMENTSGNIWTKTFNVAPGNYEWGVSDQADNWLLAGQNLTFSVSAQGTVSGQITYIIEGEISGSVLVMDRWVAYTSGETVNSATGSTFNGSNLGTFNETFSLILKGGALKSYKEGDYDVTGATMYYRIYKVSETPGNFISMSLPWKENLTESGQQLWEDLTQTVNISQGLTNGTYSLETYFALHYKIGDATTILTLTDDNAGANYKANFTYESNVGIMDNANELSILNFYPIPAVDNLTIDLPDYVKSWTIAMYNSLGQKILSVSSNSKVDVSGLAAGIYFVELKIDRFISRQKVLILRD